MTTITDTTPNCAEQLALFFPAALPVRIPVQITTLRPGKTRPRERTVIEYHTDEHAIFPTTLPLEFEDRVRLEPNRGKPALEATVIAVRYSEGNKAVAVRFLKGSSRWMAKP